MNPLARKIFLNLEIDQQKTVLYRYKEPFQTLISGPNSGQVTYGDPGGARLLLKQKSSVPPCSINREQALDLYSLRRPVEPCGFSSCSNHQI